MKQKQISKHYLSENGRKYFNQQFYDSHDFGRIFQTRFFRSFTDAKSSLLDIGCADGLALRCLPASRRIGVEVNPFARKKCEELSTSSGISIEVYSDFEPIANDSIDIAISNHCLEHVLNPYSTLSEIYRVLNKKGKLILVLPYDDLRNKEHKCWRPNDKDNHLYTWTPLNIGNLTSEAGFLVEKTAIITNSWSPKLYFVNKYFGLKMFETACVAVSILKKRRQVLCIAKKI